MSAQRERLAALRRIAEAAWQVEQSRTATIATEEAALRRRLEALDAGRTDRRRALTWELDAARLAGADPLWERWIDGRRSELMSELARVLARKDQAQRRLALAFGRKEAAGRIAGESGAGRAGRADQP
jgi:hypothetical protein